MGDRLGVQAVGLGQLAGGAGEGPHLARVDHRDRQAGGGQGRRKPDLHPAGGLEHDERRLEGDQTLDQRRHAPVVMVDGGALTRRTEVDVEPMLGNIDADEGRGSGFVHDPVSLDAGSPT
jgi:hypothetical protein